MGFLKKIAKAVTKPVEKAISAVVTTPIKQASNLVLGKEGLSNITGGLSDKVFGQIETLGGGTTLVSGGSISSDIKDKTHLGIVGAGYMVGGPGGGMIANQAYVSSGGNLAKTGLAIGGSQLGGYLDSIGLPDLNLGGIEQSVKNLIDSRSAGQYVSKNNTVDVGTGYYQSNQGIQTIPLWVYIIVIIIIFYFFIRKKRR